MTAPGVDGTPTLPASAWSPPAASDRNVVVPQCQQCGARPARQVVYRHQVGALIVTQQFTEHGIYCRDCGLSKVRSAQNRTLIVGWIGFLSVLRNLGALAHNGREMKALKRLGPPSAPLPGARPLSPGRPVFLRFGALVGAGVVALAVGIGYTAATAPGWEVGACVRGDVRVEPVDCSAQHDGQIVVRAPKAGACPTAAESYVSVMGSTDVWCVDLDK